MKKLNIINSASGLSTWWRCHKLWKYKYIDKYEPVDDGSFELSYGSYFHSLIENNPKTDFGAKWRAVTEAHHYAYTKSWEAKSEQSIDYYSRELPFEIEPAPGYKYHGYIDGLGTYKKKYVVVETKTTGSKLSEFFTRADTLLQPRLYVAAMRLTGKDVEGFVLDVTRRPGIRQKKTESDECFVQRVADWYYDNSDEAFARKYYPVSSAEADSVIGEVMMVTDLQRNGIFPENRDSCYAFRRQCSFKPVCFGTEKLTNTELFKERTRK